MLCAPVQSKPQPPCYDYNGKDAIIGLGECEGFAGYLRANTPHAAALSAAPAALVDLLHGLNMVLLRIGFELLRRSGFVRWLRNLIQVNPVHNFASCMCRAGPYLVPASLA